MIDQAAERPVLGTDAEGWRYASSYGITYRLTPCCGASLKGAEHGVVCRGCYGDVPIDAHLDPVEPLTPDIPVSCPEHAPMYVPACDVCRRRQTGQSSGRAKGSPALSR